ncbi:16S rRNA (guanine(966)-N(2))-methyltransferase RsmD [Vibrio algarum]|uniref:Ribosomal RNA small subunit methyltransferase D n=1 Tax=Vibrio algarum TaxID=3020714 RepID=A0ABT4YMC3_9VIBR|nr:16S rRNA (guanine(966)-N(2))-methyltransferase RsmD [Vibrio sp. KJ40-1]MDB1122678.1 16S rRNA (guanine(966)-N(2))-methyltransferase RsmD [Vibrio sp. KJ40-1]
MVRSRTKNNSQKKQPEGSIRIISGLWRGRKLPVFNAEGLRPTTDRVKETLFNWIAQDVPHAKCLDLFAGSGGLGLEAASRQASQVVMLELNSQAHKQLTQNISALNASAVEAINTDSLAFLEKHGTPFDIVFIDPPFRQGLLESSIKLLEENNWLAENAMIYIETEKELTLTAVPENWTLHREKSAGQVSYRLFERNAE